MDTRELQTRLAALGFDPGPIDGRDGKLTKAATEAFQAKFGLVVDGIAGQQTQTALLQAVTPASPTAQPEPNKSAMGSPAPAAAGGAVVAMAPPNAATLELLSTARPIDEIIIHCTATPEGKDYTVADVRAWHKQRGWSDIGYHYVVYRDGTVHEGRPVGQVGAHVENHNTGTIGISYIGGLSSNAKAAKDTRTPSQRTSLLWLVQQLAAKHRGIKRVTGHNQYAAKACPSFDVRKDPLGKVV
jgi:N-acetylmuramoyl-L-alanine amidase